MSPVLLVDIAGLCHLHAAHAETIEASRHFLADALNGVVVVLLAAQATFLWWCVRKASEPLQQIADGLGLCSRLDWPHSRVAEGFAVQPVRFIPALTGPVQHLFAWTVDPA